MKVDLGEFVGIFVEEAREHLDAMESLLLALSPNRVDGEMLNALFRAAHSIKGGAATFGLDEVAGLAHVAESLLDRLRDQRLALSADIVDALLVATDVMRAQIAAFEGHAAVPAPQVEAARAQLSALAGPVAVPAPAAWPALPAEAPLAMPPSAALPAPVVAAAEANEATEAAGPLAGEGVAFGFFEDMPEPLAGAVPASSAMAEPPAASASAGLPAPSAGPGAAHAGHESSSIRVSVDKVDQIINLVGELVIIQSMLAQHAQSETPQQIERLRSGLDLLDRNTRSLQEAAMAVRMMPISAVFSRFPRLARDLAQRLGKEVEIRLEGEGTELDKGLIERIVDPLTHLVRNSLDHGLELPAERVAAGKPVAGAIALSARHEGGSIVIEVADDGRGLDRERILAKARERGMAVPEQPTDAQVWALIFEAGFSTAAAVTDVSGRGVGMDVVRRNIQALGGRVDIHSEKGRGTRIAVRLPLTLAILDGLSVACGGEVFIVPLAFIVESLRAEGDAVRSVAGAGRVLRIRGRYLPVVALHEVLGLSGGTPPGADGIFIVLETEGQRIALFVDALLGQHQVVIKSLEANYRKVAGISGATIMGDGRVALILDAAGLGRQAASSVRLPSPLESAGAFLSTEPLPA
ncbi:two-component system chemotaxis sensor kinase CheA [Pseudacidovorax intermedius]|uniref:Chemotaxis protein CheA n=1 Tax=Pseudacidovorax intermedius TaxID=433924 RepID=A0A370FIG1_9BURK|nr:chemotaxis protein CheW [Pseudacidovorax intermedius]RDI26133.1 two-component system chemotaxis sensor kinase CheA [Pseudacidovorax intermedius]